MSTAKSGERWRDDLPERWDEVGLWPPLPDREIDQEGELELLELQNGAVIQTGRGWVWCHDDQWILELEDCN